MTMMKKTFALTVSVVLVSCTTGHTDEVYSAIESRFVNDGKIITVQGILQFNSGYYNIFSEDRKECIGLLLTDRQRQSYKELIDRKAVVTGKLDAEGCGRDGICVEHICGPTILKEASISLAGSVRSTAPD